MPAGCRCKPETGTCSGCKCFSKGQQCTKDCSCGHLCTRSSEEFKTTKTQERIQTRKRAAPKRKEPPKKKQKLGNQTPRGAGENPILLRRKESKKVQEPQKGAGGKPILLKRKESKKTQEPPVDIKFFSLVSDTILERDALLQESTDFYAEHSKYIDSVRNSLAYFYTTEGVPAIFFASLLVAATRCWEAFKKDSNGTRVFDDTDVSRPGWALRMDCERVVTATEKLHTIQFKKLSSEQPEIKKAISNLKKNLSILQTICGQDLDEQMFDAFLSQLTVYSFSPGLALEGLSSLYGDTLFVVVTQLVEEAAVRTIEHEVVHCLERWINKISGKVDFRHFSPEKNPNIRTPDGHLLEAGNFYELTAYGEHVPLGPFCLRTLVKKY